MVKKVTQKDKLFGDNQLPQALKECAIHELVSGLSHVVQLFKYTENQDEIVMYQEYCDQAQFLEHQIMERHKEFKDEAELRRMAS